MRSFSLRYVISSVFLLIIPDLVTTLLLVKPYSIKNNPNNVGGQGFASMTENEEFQIGTWIDTGFLAGEAKMVYDKDKGWGTYYKESPDVESEYDGMEFTIWGTQAANYLTTKVPTVDKSLEGLLQKAGVLDAKNKLTEAFMDINAKDENGNLITKVTYNKDGTIAVTTVGANWEAAAIAINKCYSYKDRMFVLLF